MKILNMSYPLTIGPRRVLNIPKIIVNFNIMFIVYYHIRSLVTRKSQ